jgi:biopolymer transport protein ExbB
MPDALWRTFDYLKQGGWTMVPLVAVSIAMWALIADRVRAYRALTAGDLPPAAAVAAVRGGGAEASPAGAAASGLRSRLVAAFLAERTGSPELDPHILQQISLSQRQVLDRHLAIIAILAAIAPLLGLLGTVLGMIQTFQVISLFGTGNARAMAGGISVALITTQTGLLVAIPGLFAASALTRRSRRLQIQLDEITHILERTLKGEPPKQDDPPPRAGRAAEWEARS